MNRLWHELRLALLAWQFLTRLPLPRALAERMGYEPAWLHDSARHFPLIGALVGLFGAAAYAAGAVAFTPAVAAGLCIAATVWLTGCFHEDGWADTCDALGGAVSRERALQIMKDSRIGAYGAAGLVLMLGLKWSALASLPLAMALPALVMGHSASRAVAVSLIRWLPYGGDPEHAKAKPLSQHLGTGGWVAALAWTGLCAGIVSMLLPLQALAAGLVAAAAAGLHCRRWFRRRLGGFTGDCLGAAQQLSELAFYLGVLAAWRWSF